MTEKYTKEDHEAYRKEQDEKAAKEEEARNERMEKETARRSWPQFFHPISPRRAA
jgi:hypothetical protein